MPKRKTKIKKPRKKRKFNLAGLLIATARRISRWHPAKTEAYKLAEIGPNMWHCAKCRKPILGKDNSAADHIEPVISTTPGLRPQANWENGIFANWDLFFSRLYVTAKGYQILHKTCHQKKSNKENAERRANKKAAKDVI